MSGMRGEQKDSIRQHWLYALVMAMLIGCAAQSGYGGKTQGPLSPEDERLRHKFRGIHGLVLRIDAGGKEKYGVLITSDTGRVIDAPSGVSPKGASNLTYTDNSAPIPKAVRATWREGDFRSLGQSKWEGGTIVGDYTVPVAERIPDEVLDYIRQNGGTLRVKIRLLDNGIAIGWDVEERYTTQYGSGVRNKLPGGDFREAQIFNGRVTDPGW